MSLSIEKTKPKLFTIFRVICILLGAFSLFAYSMTLILSAVPDIKKTFESVGLTNTIIFLDIIRSSILLMASIWIFKMKKIGWNLILICVAWDTLELIYDFIRSYSSSSLISVSNLVSGSFFIINVLIFIYFIKPEVKAYVTAEW